MIVTLHRREKPPHHIAKGCYFRAEAEIGPPRRIGADWDRFCRRYAELVGRWIFRDALAWLEAGREDFEVLAVTVAGIDSRGTVGFPLEATTASLVVGCAGVDAAVLFKLACG
jgi:hypothetical protein